MRISDWSSDVCSSDLGVGGLAGRQLHHQEAAPVDRQVERVLGLHDVALAGDAVDRRRLHAEAKLHAGRHDGAGIRRGRADAPQVLVQQVLELRAVALERSEEHTSELQSLMRISYAVFCLKKKN